MTHVWFRVSAIIENSHASNIWLWVLPWSGAQNLSRPGGKPFLVPATFHSGSLPGPPWPRRSAPSSYTTYSCSMLWWTLWLNKLGTRQVPSASSAHGWGGLRSCSCMEMFTITAWRTYMTPAATTRMSLPHMLSPYVLGHRLLAILDVKIAYQWSKPSNGIDDKTGTKWTQNNQKL